MSLDMAHSTRKGLPLSRLKCKSLFTISAYSVLQRHSDMPLARLGVRRNGAAACAQDDAVLLFP